MKADRSRAGSQGDPEKKHEEVTQSIIAQRNSLPQDGALKEPAG